MTLDGNLEHEERGHSKDFVKHFLMFLICSLLFKTNLITMVYIRAAKKLGRRM